MRVLFTLIGFSGAIFENMISNSQNKNQTTNNVQRAHQEGIRN